MKYSARYKKGFKEGYNNPKQNSNINLDKIKKQDDLIDGIIGGVCKRKEDIQKGINGFIWNEEDLKNKLEGK